MPSRVRRSANHKSYTYEHDKRRKELIPLAIGTPCPCRSRNCRRHSGQPTCGRLMVNPKQMDLGHDPPLCVDPTPRPGNVVICASCNRSEGAVLGNRIRAARKRQQLFGIPPPPSRQW